MKRFTRKQILDKFNKMIERKIPIIGGGAGTGISAKCEEDGGIDLIVIYNSGRYRMLRPALRSITFGVSPTTFSSVSR